MRPLVSVVMATFNRWHLLSRSLKAYENQRFDNRELELVIIDDHSTDNTVNKVKIWAQQTGISTVVVTPCPKLTTWRDCGAVLNYGIRVSRGKNVILTHPEVIPGRCSVANCVDRLQQSNWLYACCRVYYLSPRDQERIETVNWQAEGNLAVRNIQDFYDEDIGNPDFSHRATDIIAKPGSRLPHWESWVFGGCSRDTWEKLGGMLETQHWGSVDVAFMERRRALGIINHTCPDDDTIVVHQNHDGPNDVKTPRIEEVWRDELKNVKFNNPNELVYPHIDNL